MFKIINQAFIALLSFSRSLSTKFIYEPCLNNEPCLTRPTLIDLNSMNFIIIHLWIV